jgi:putative ABC transport system substrate-binding protein
MLAALAVGAMPTAASAQSGKTHRIGLLMATNPAAAGHVAAAFADGLRALGRVEGTQVTLEYRWAEGDPARFPALAEGLVRQGVDVIVASSSDAALAAKRATSRIPVAMVNAADPVEVGLVASLIEPGGNVTGLSAQLTPEIRAKLLQLLKEALPGLARVTILRRTVQAGAAVWKEYEAAGRSLGLRIHFADVGGLDALGAALAAIARERGTGLLVPGDPVFFTERQRIVALATQHRLAGIYATREYAEAGGLMSYSARLTDQFRRAAGYVDKILKGTQPGSLPVEQPTAFELVVNLRTARALGLTLPPAFLLRADQVIE